MFNPDEVNLFDKGEPMLLDENSLKMLKKLESSGNPMTARSLRSELKLSKSTVNTRLHRLIGIGFVERRKKLTKVAKGRWETPANLDVFHYSTTRRGKWILRVTSAHKALEQQASLNMRKTIALDERCCAFLAETLKAPDVEGDDTRPSSIFRHITISTKIKPDGYCHTQHEIEMLQLLPRQGIITPLLYDKKKAIVEWNNRNITSLLQPTTKLSATSLFDYPLSGTVEFFDRDITEDIHVGTHNRLHLECEARLMLCELEKDKLYSFCVPVFHADDGIDVQIVLPQRGLSNISANLLLRNTERNGRKEWSGCETVKVEENAIRIAYEKPPRFSDVKEKRYRPDLLTIKFTKDDPDAMKNSAILSEDIRQNFLRIGTSLNFLCGERSCPEKRHI